MKKSCLTCASTGKIVGLGQMQKTCPLCEGFGFIEETEQPSISPIIGALFEPKVDNVKIPTVTIKKSRGRPKQK
jgi:RecJ-like exonuclease